MRKQTALWTCKDGRRIRVCDMEDSHLLNTIRMLDRAWRRRIALMPFPAMQGEYAQEAAEQEFFDAMDAITEDFYPIHKNLVLDAQRRGIL